MEKSQITEREKAIAHRYASGETYKQIASQLYIAPATVRNHLSNVYRKLDVKNKPELINGLSGMDLTTDLVCMVDTGELSPASVASIAVMPFTNLGNSDRDHFVDGVTTNIHNYLTRCHDLLVSGRSSCLAISKQTADAKRVAQKLGVHYIAQGNVRSEGNSVRIVVELVEGESRAVIWSERYDRTLHDILKIEAEVAESIAVTLSVKIEDAQYYQRNRLSSDQLLAYDWRLRGNHSLELGGAENIEKAKNEFFRALELEPESAAAFAGLSMAYGYERDQLLVSDYSKSLDKHCEYAEKAVALDESDSRGHYAMSCAALMCGQFELADLHADRAIELNPSEYHNICSKGYSLMCQGNFEDSVASFKQSLRRNPLAPNSCLLGLGFTDYLGQHYGQAAFTFSRIPSDYCMQSDSLLAATYGQLEYRQVAQALGNEFLRLAKSIPASPLQNRSEDWREFWQLVYPYVKGADFEHVLKGIEKSGLPV